MTFISYAQNFEDVILWRALKQVERGFYIDVGAQDPIVDSVSLAFYEQGWRGLHVEPNADYAAKLRDVRSDETVIEKAIGAEADKIAFWEFPDTGLSTGVHAIAEKHRNDGRKSRKTEVACVPLSAVLDSCRDRDVHWLKIDVEGMERSVIESWSPSPVRPWIVIVESTKPNSQEESFAEWQPSLVALGYEFVYFDGVNRFYLSREHAALKPSFGFGPNVFDGFTLSATSSYCHMINVEFQARLAANDAEIGRLGQELARIQSENQMLLARLATTEGDLSRLNQQLAMAQAENQTLLGKLATSDGEIGRLHSVINHHNEWGQATMERVRQLTGELLAIQSSRTWRMTAPLRKLAKAASRAGAKRGPAPSTLVSRFRRKRRPANLSTPPGQPSSSRDEIQTRSDTEGQAILFDAMRGWSPGKRLDA